MWLYIKIGKLTYLFVEQFTYIEITWTEQNGMFTRDKEGNIWESVFTEDDFEMEVNVGIVMDKDKLSFSIGACINLFQLNFNKRYFTFPFPIFAWLEFVIAIIPSVNINVCFNSGLIINWKKKEYSFFIDICGQAEVSITLDLGLYIPSQKTIVSISINIGLHGILGSGAVGVKLMLYLNKDRFIVDTYFQLTALQFTFYIMFRITINLDEKLLKIFKVKKLSYDFIIYSYKLASLISYEYHIQRGYKYNAKEIPELCKNKGEYNMNFFNITKNGDHGGKCKIL